MRTKVAAIILAAGQGSRIGQPKLFLKTGDRTFLESVTKTLADAGLADITAVVRNEDRERAAGLIQPRRVRVNGHPENGPLSSLRTGLDAQKDRDGYLICPVDHPAVAADTIRALLAAFDAQRGNVVKPAFNGKAGHPVLIPAALAKRIPDKDIAGGLAKVIAGSGVAVTLVPVDDDAVLKNINTMDDIKHG
ncbi:MAG TPA: nucleotidyltransferase family protein [Candidatus Edwardsbacteria bacterium]|nr:nucleotidyltransferase family protein [Candidatus Edwardsbacteria bacterium]